MLNCIFLLLSITIVFYVLFGKNKIPKHHLTQHFCFFFMMCWGTIDISVSLPSAKFLEICQFAHVFSDTTCYSQSGHVFLSKTNFCANGHWQLCQLCHVIDGDMLNVFHSPAHLFCCFYFPLLALHRLQKLSQLQWSSFPPWFPFPDVLITTDATTDHWDFCCQGSGLPLFFSGTWSDSICKVHMTLQEL